jgi:NADPH2:quinone reductase
MFMAREPARGRAQLEEILGWAKEGTLKPHIHARYPLERALDALRDVEQRRVQGKAVVVPEGAG